MPKSDPQPYDVIDGIETDIGRIYKPGTPWPHPTTETKPVSQVVTINAINPTHAELVLANGSRVVVANVLETWAHASDPELVERRRFLEARP